MRLRVCEPPPHEAEHDPHAPHADTTQSWPPPSHEPVLHAWVWVRLPHGVPPWLAGVTTVRVRSWMPPPHSAEQVPHALHPDTAHATGDGAPVHMVVPPGQAAELGNKE